MQNIRTLSSDELILGFTILLALIFAAISKPLFS